MLQERDVFREVIRLVGLALLVYGLYMALQSGLSIFFFSPFTYGAHINWLLLISPIAYALLGLVFLLRPAPITAFAYPRPQIGEWGSRQMLTMGIKLSGLWLIIAHLDTFLRHLQYCLSQVPILGQYQVLTHNIWIAVAIYLVIIVIGVIMFRYQPRDK
ncbi:MAG TPA: hypothetical protein PLG09_10485 [Syntrophomonadaceae bacterium]|jgi:hypothetical protein|nr:hypothetical protein [Syntrophomonadaceae bacterium]HOQ10539.1 hypothetical protein [Syntrophomonadaceae bacterium]HPU49683.1 hypothetical protein [Syntrophomonadaceae bacterium]